MPERMWPGLIMPAVLALAGCGAAAIEPAPTSAPPTPATTSAAPSSPSPSPSASPASTRDGTYANELSVSEDGALSFVPLRWYTGPNAEARCEELGIEPELAWCSDYYYEKAGDRRAAALTDQTKVRLLNSDLELVDATLAELVEAIESEEWPHFQIAATEGRVVKISQVFTP